MKPERWGAEEHATLRLRFLHAARPAGFTALHYRDHAEGAMEEIAPGRQAVTRVVLHPQIEWQGAALDQNRLDAMHNEAHEACYVANWVRTEVIVAPAVIPDGFGADSR